MNKVSDIILAHDSFASLHVQLNNQLHHLILSGRWPSGTRIPSENELTSYLNVSRSTVRLALQQAELEGLIQRKPGKGTFVANIAQQEKPSRLIAFVTCMFASEMHLLLLNGAEEEVKANGYRMIFSNVQSHAEEIGILQGMRAEGVAGVLLWPNAQGSHPDQQNTALYQQLDLPMVMMDRQIHGFECDCVTSDNYGGGRALMKHLIELGHREIVFLSHHEVELLPVKERYRAYCTVLQEHGLTPHEPWFIGHPGDEIGDGYAMLSSVDDRKMEFSQFQEYLVKAIPRPTAIFGANDSLAILASWALKQLDVRVPETISVAGFDDINLAVHLEVPLTTVAQDPFTIGKRAAQLLIDQLQGNSGPTRCEIIPTQLRIRSSTAVLEHV